MATCKKKKKKPRTERETTSNEKQLAKDIPRINILGPSFYYGNFLDK